MKILTAGEIYEALKREGYQNIDNLALAYCACVARAQRENDICSIVENIYDFECPNCNLILHDTWCIDKSDYVLREAQNEDRNPQ